MSERLRARFASAKAEGRAAFLPYVTAGYPRRDQTVPILLGLEAGGADVIELGVPFTDPLADGATIQRANEVAVAQGITFADCLAMVREARAQGLATPILLMGYNNPILAYGEERAAADGAAEGIDGFIVVDLPPEEAGNFRTACATHGLSFVPLISPTTPEDRVAMIDDAADSFIYCVSVTGTTGQREELPSDLASFVARIRRQTNLPLALGFGVSTPEQVATVGKLTEGVVVGSAIIAAIDAAGAGDCGQRVKEFVEYVTGQSRDGEDSPA